jgi:hypothetical protein
MDADERVTMEITGEMRTRHPSSRSSGQGGLGDDVKLYVAAGRAIIFVSTCNVQSEYTGTLSGFR